jgi:5-methylcytosine-specific restriction protein A
MGWESSDRRDRLPTNWAKVRQEVFKRYGRRCVWRLPSGKQCPREATEIDHIQAKTDDHSIAALRPLCGFHHDKKSAAEGRAAQAAKKASRYRPREEHPGTLS